MPYTTITYEVAEHIATVTLDRAEVRNAFNPTMGVEFADVWARVSADDDVRVVVLQANGPAFCSGIDVKDRAPVPTNLYNAVDPGRPLGPKQAEVWKPVVAAVQGVAAGGAFAWLNECDVVICSRDARFVDPHLSIGLTTSLTAIGMVRNGIALRDALRIALLSNDEPTSAERARQIGLVSEVVDGDELRPRARALAALIAAKAPAAVQGSVRAIWTSLDMAWPDARAMGPGPQRARQPGGPTADRRREVVTRRAPCHRRACSDGVMRDRDEVDPGLPLKLWPCSNGEYLPPPLDDLRREAMRRARAAADLHARRHGWSRRRFLLSSAGMASGLVALQACSDEQSQSSGSEPGGRFTVPPSAAADPEEAAVTVHGPATSAPVTRTQPAPVEDPEVVVDVQTHFLESGEWGVSFPQSGCGEADPIDCYSAAYWRDLVFGQSDTAVAVISAVPVVGAADPLSIDAMERGKALASELCGDDRVLIQGHAVPDVGPLEVALGAMAEVVAAHQLSAWKVYTHASGGWYLDDHDPAAAQVGAAFLDAVATPASPSSRCTRACRAATRSPRPSTSARRPRPIPSCRSSCTTRATRRVSPRDRSTPTATASTAWCAA